MVASFALEPKWGSGTRFAIETEEEKGRRRGEGEKKGRRGEGEKERREEVEEEGRGTYDAPVRVVGKATGKYCEC